LITNTKLITELIVTDRADRGFAENA